MKGKKYSVVLELEVFSPYNEVKLKEAIEEELMSMDGVSVNNISTKECDNE